VVRINRWIGLLSAGLLIILVAAGQNVTELPSSPAGSAETGQLTDAGDGLEQPAEVSGALANESSAATGMQRILPAEIVGKVRSGQRVEYERAYIAGDLDLTGLDRPVMQGFHIINSTINGSLILEGVTFEEGVDLSGTTVAGASNLARVTMNGDTSFAESRFLRPTSFRFARFAGITLFRDSSFQGMADFGYAQFSKLVSFEGTTFWEPAGFMSLQCLGDASFEKVKFLKLADFQLARFSQLVSFWRAVFSGETIFANSQVDGIANYLETQYRGNVTFMGANYRTDATFSQANFSRAAIFGLASFSGFSDFSKARFGGVAIFAVAKSADTIRFVNASFEGDFILDSSRIYTLQLDEARYSERTRISMGDADITRVLAGWDDIREHLAFDNAAYLGLVRNYRNLEWRDDANNCYYQYRRAVQAAEPWSLNKAIDIISWLSCGYGVRVSYTIFWCIFTILIFGVVLWAGNGMRNFDLEEMARSGANSEDLASQRVSLVDALYFSVAMFTTSQAPVNTYPVGYYRHLAMLEGILGWFLLGLFVVVLAGVLIQ